MTVKEILAAVVERRHDHDRREARRRRARLVDRPLRVRQADRRRLPGRELRARAAARGLVGLDDRHRADRPGHRRDAAADGRPPTPTIGNGGVLPTPAPRREGRQQARAPREAAAASSREHTADRMMTMFRDVVRRGHRHRGRDPGLHGRRQDRHRAEGRERPLRRRKYVASFVGLVPAKKPAARDPRDGGRAARATSTAASSRRRPSATSRASTSSTSRCRRTRRRRRPAR